MQDALFYTFAFLTLVFGFLVIANPFSRNPVTSAMFLVLTIVSLAGLFVLWHAFFLAAVQGGMWTLAVVGVRVERLQEISEADAIAEGIVPLWLDGSPIRHDGTGAICRSHFQNLWDSINGKRADAAWADNPWVWVVEFKRI